MIVEKNSVIHPNDLKIINNLILETKTSFVFKINSTPKFKKIKIDTSQFIVKIF